MCTDGFTTEQVFHPLVCGDDTAVPQLMNDPFFYTPHPLALKAAATVQADIHSHEEWREEIDKGKMFGILVVRDATGVVGYLKAFSAQLQGTFSQPGWVPPIYDFLAPDGFFRKEEAQISALNDRVRLLLSDKNVADAIAALQSQEQESASVIEAMRREVAERKARRDALRKDLGYTTPEMVRESQFMKAELRRVVKAQEAKLQPLRDAVRSHRQQVEALKGERKRRSEALQKRLFDSFVVTNGRGEEATLSQLFSKTPQVVPPSGSGECCAPKLLNYALRHGMTPLALAEFWWGRSPVGLIRRHLSYYPACSGKCKPILGFMLQGVAVEEDPLSASNEDVYIPVVYEDQWMMVIDKPSGMLSAPGRTATPCVIDMLLQQRTGLDTLYNVNRLDMQTSGLLVLAKSEEAQVALRRMFERREMKKVYEAVLDGEFCGPHEGTIALPLSPDYIHRPCQKVDREEGKEAITHYYILRVREGRTFVRLHPVTGRTHQLRVHCAHHDGLAIPIVGDSLYGTPSGTMLLRCVKMSFRHPFTGESINLEVPTFDCFSGC